MLQKLNDMWDGFNKKFKFFLIAVACILVFALVSNIFN